MWFSLIPVLPLMEVPSDNVTVGNIHFKYIKSIGYGDFPWLTSKYGENLQNAVKSCPRSKAYLLKVHYCWFCWFKTDFFATQISVVGAFRL